jgi:transposase-like protein
MLTLSSDSSSLFKRRHSDPSIIILCVRWYVTYKPSYRDLRDMMAEHGSDKESATLPSNVCVRTSKYLNDLVEQDHRRVKQRVYPMLGFKRFKNAAVTISGIELAHKIKKGQFDTSTVEEAGVRAQQLWEAVLAE